ncbi:phosphodiesterase [Haematococcus lacustris]|uniref:Phosphodiesterase n=1 Tax=Haematococcus lacustris TaxID=44745 RepID=A0A6A0A069_HAELA|nr:phosphodiesterase [Haematococcus lacustris]
MPLYQTDNVPQGSSTHTKTPKGAFGQTSPIHSHANVLLDVSNTCIKTLGYPTGNAVLAMQWELCVWVDSWHPTFTKPVMAAMVLISFLLAGAVFAVLLSRHENMALLHSLLPKSTINKLHANFQWTSGASAMLLESGTPAELMLQVVEDILSDKPPDLAKVMMVRSALQQSLDIYKPLADDLSVRLAQVKYVDVPSGQGGLAPGKECHQCGRLGVLRLVLCARGGDEGLPHPARLQAHYWQGLAGRSEPLIAAFSSEVREALMAQLMGRRPKSETGCEGEDPIGLNADPVPDVLDELDELDEVPDRPSEHPDSYPAPVVQVLSRVIAAEQPVDADVAPALQASSDAVAKDQPLAVSVLDPEPPTPAEPQFMLTLRPMPKASRCRPDQALPAMLSLQTASSTPGAQYHSTGNVQRAALESSLAEQPATLAFVGELVGRELDRIAPSTLTTMLRRIMAQRLPELQPPGSGIALLAAATQLQLKPLQGGSDGDVPLKAKPGHRGPDWETAQPPTLKPAPMREVEACLAAAHSWEFDAFQLTAVTGGRPLSVLAYWLLQKTGLVSAIRLDPAKLARWLCRIEAGYCSNAYHNRSHAADVVQTLHMLLTQGGLAPGYADPLTQLAAYLAAVCHDYQHLGRTNDWLIETRDELALRYNDRSPMENHHLAAAFSLLKDPELNFLALLPKASWERLRKLMVELVLGTDMKQHFSIIGAFTALHRLSTSEAQGSARISGAGKQESLPSYGKASSSTVDELQPVSEQDKLLSLQMALKCSDLGHLAAPLPVHLAWVARLEAEFFAQGDAERAQGLAISPLCDRTKQGITKSQVGFFDFVALLLFKNFTARFTAAKPLLHGVLRNYAHWQAQAADS